MSYMDGVIIRETLMRSPLSLIRPESIGLVCTSWFALRHPLYHSYSDISSYLLISIDERVEIRTQCGDLAEVASALQFLLSSFSASYQASWRTQRHRRRRPKTVALEFSPPSTESIVGFEGGVLEIV